MPRPGRAAGPTIQQIQLAVARHYGLLLRELVGPKRHRRVAEPRMIAIWLSRDLTGASMPEIGRAFDRHHTAVLNALRRVEHMIATEPKVAQDIETLRLQLVGVEPRRPLPELPPETTARFRSVAVAPPLYEALQARGRVAPQVTKIVERAHAEYDFSQPPARFGPRHRQHAAIRADAYGKLAKMAAHQGVSIPAALETLLVAELSLLGAEGPHRPTVAELLT